MRHDAPKTKSGDTLPAHAISPFDLLIRGGLLFDGTGAEGLYADVGISGDRIAAIGNLSGAEAGRVLDASGKHVAPGFIDIHTHSDISVTYDPEQASAIGMGVTAQVTGNCGLCMALATDADVFASEKRWVGIHGARIAWKTFAEHLRRIEEVGVATNYIPLAAHGTLRKRVMGLAERLPDAGEMAQMRRELAQAMAEGAWGFSSGLEYPPSAYAGEVELTDLCRIAAEAGGFYATHLRNEGDTLVEAVQEALNVAEGAALPLQLSHHKCEGRHNWGKSEVTLQLVNEAAARGLDVQLDQYPYTAFMTALGVQTLPQWALQGSGEELAARLSDPAQRARILAETRRAHPDWDDLSDASPWHTMQIGVCRGRPEIQGKTIASLATEARQNPMDFVLDLLAETAGFVSAVNFAIGETDIARIMRHPRTMIGSDGVATHPTGTGGGDKIHPRAYGTFPRVLGRYVRELGILSHAEAIHKMTGLPAARLGLADRGRLAPGCFADITIYDPETVNDCATFDAPHQFAQGIETVLVNGRVALENGVSSGTRAGRVLRR